MFSFGKWFGSKDRRRYRDHGQLFTDLAAQEPRAILYLQDRGRATAARLVREAGLPTETTDELLNQATLIFLRKIADGGYEFRGHDPLTYLVEVAKRLVLAATRRKNPDLLPLEQVGTLPDPDQEERNRRRDAAELVTTLLDRLGDPCAHVIRLFHIEGYSDREVVELKLTDYGSVASLKVKRSSCMRKLIELAQAWKTVNPI